jgi:integrase
MMKTCLPYLSREQSRHGTECLYVRRSGRRIRINEPEGTPAFAKAYSEALERLEVAPAANTRLPYVSAPRGTLGWLGALYFASSEFGSIYPKSRQARRSNLESCFREPRKPGVTDLMRDCPVNFVTASHIKMLRDRRAVNPGAANNRLKHLSALFGWAVEAGYATTNPARDVRKIRYQSSGYHSWTLAERKQYEERHPIGTKARLALALLLLTGCRRQDMVTLGRQHVRDCWLRFVPQKTMYKRSRLSEKPLLPLLTDIIAASPCGDLTFLVTAHGKPFTANGFGNWFRDRCNEAGLPHCTAHGLRKAGAALAAENGATEQQLMAIFDWDTPRQAAVYTKAASRKRMAGDAMAMLSTDHTANDRLSHPVVAPKKGSPRQ